MKPERVCHLTEEIKQCMREVARLSHAGLSISRERRKLGDRIRAAQNELAEDFGRQRGWRLSERPISPASLTRRARNTRAEDYLLNAPFCQYLDHPYYYRISGRAAGIAAHLYSVPANLAALAECIGLRAAVIGDFPSWWNPGSTMLVLYTPLLDR